MFLENLVVDAVDPWELGRFWEAAVGAEPLTDEPAGYEARLTAAGGFVLDLCFQPVAEAASEPLRLQLATTGGSDPTAEVRRLLGLGARRLDDARGDVAPSALADPEGNPFRFWADPPADAGDGPLAAFLLDSADPDRDAAFWSWLTGWTDGGGSPRTLRHPSGSGPVLQLRSEPAPKGTGKNRMHLDVRLEPGDDADRIVAGVVERGGAELQHPEWGVQPWRFCADPSGNDVCLLPARS